MSSNPALGRSSSAVTAQLSIMMFLQFFLWGSWYVSMTGWMNQAHIGGLTFWAYTVGPIAAIISPFFLGAVADRLFASQRVLGVLHILGGAILMAVPAVVKWANHDVPGPEQATFFHPYVYVLLLHMLCYMPTLGLTNTVCFHNMSDPAKQFPMVRVFGTIGWIVGNILVAGSLAAFGVKGATWIQDGDKSPAQFYIAGAAGVVLGLFSFFLPNTPPPAKGKKFRVGEILGVDSLKLLAKPAYLVFIICSFLICIPLAAYYANARNFVEHVGFSTPTLTMSFGQMAEIIFMVLMPLFFIRLGVKWMLAVGMLAWVIRYALFAGASTMAGSPAMALTIGGVILHGICYDFFFVTGFIYVDRKAPREIRGQAQGFLVLVTQGLGLGAGSLLIGEVVKHYSSNGVMDWKMIWGIPAAFAALVLVIFMVFFREDKSIDKPTDAGGATH